MFWFKKKDGQKHTFINHEKRERLFFHDMINQTHGLILFFSQRQSVNKAISVEEIKMLEREVRTLQSMIKDHFHGQHKNLASTYDWVPFDVAERAVESLIQTYLSDESIQTSLDRNLNGIEVEKALVYFPAFYRIMNNLIKNMAEAKTCEVHISFYFDQEGLSIVTKNQRNLMMDSKSISDKQAGSILPKCSTAAFTVEGLGLESINYLALERGGRFDFEISNEYWINRIFLPSFEKKIESKDVHKKHHNEQKKAA